MKDEAPHGPPLLDVNSLQPDQAVHRLIERAAELRASDLFFATNDNHVAVSIRHLGLTRLLSKLLPDQGKRCLAHLKAVAGMDVAEKRRPHDGRRLYERDDG